MKRPDVTDAEFTVIREGRSKKPRQWNGLGIPPQWGEWGWFARLVFVVVYLWLAWWALMFIIEVKALVPLVLR